MLMMIFQINSQFEGKALLGRICVFFLQRNSVKWRRQKKTICKSTQNVDDDLQINSQFEGKSFLEESVCCFFRNSLKWGRQKTYL
jgi:hypothetical protein